MSTTAGLDQLTFDELGTPLREVTFVVVDLETTGGRAGADAITEVGAVKVRGGQVLGELATLVDSGRGVPPMIAQLTGITTAMLVGAPTVGAVLPSFLEFAAGAVLVAHNAAFDTDFLRAACAQQGVAWPSPQVLCTVRLARRVLTRDEAPSVRLSALAQLLGARTTPTHRALDDARATVDVLHSLLERVGNLGVHSLEELLAFLPEVTVNQRRKRGLAEHLPHAPGVYLFRGPGAEVLYVGTATDLHRRVRSYFTGAETRRRIREMVTLAVHVDHVVCAHPLEAGVRELRLLGAHAPPYNRRSKFPHRAWWVVLTDEAFPRLSVVRTERAGALGPFRNRGRAAAAAELLAEATGMRTCTQRIAVHSPAAIPVRAARDGALRGAVRRCATGPRVRHRATPARPARRRNRPGAAGPVARPHRRPRQQRTVRGCGGGPRPDGGAGGGAAHEATAGRPGRGRRAGRGPAGRCGRLAPWPWCGPGASPPPATPCGERPRCPSWSCWWRRRRPCWQGRGRCGGHPWRRLPWWRGGWRAPGCGWCG